MDLPARGNRAVARELHVPRALRTCAQAGASLHSDGGAAASPNRSVVEVEPAPQISRGRALVLK